jgi:hypothetical protein
LRLPEADLFMALNGSLYSLGNKFIFILIVLTMASILINYPDYWKQVVAYAVFVLVTVLISFK